GRIIFVHPEIVGEVSLSAINPVGTLKRDESLAPPHHFSHHLIGYIYSYIQFVTVRIAHDEGMFCSGLGNRFIDIAQTDEAETIVCLELDRPLSRRRGL